MRGIFLKGDKKTSQDLSLGALSYTTSFNRRFKLEQIIFHFSQAVTETITITPQLSGGSTNYNGVMQSVALIAEMDFVYRPQGDANFQTGDEIKIECSNSNLVGIIYATIKTSELGGGG